MRNIGHMAINKASLLSLFVCVSVCVWTTLAHVYILSVYQLYSEGREEGGVSSRVHSMRVHLDFTHKKMPLTFPIVLGALWGIYNTSAG